MPKYSSFGDLANALARVSMRMRAVQQAGLEEAAVLVETTAKGKIGVGDRRWPPLAPYTLEDKARRGFPVPYPLLRTGELRGSISHWSSPVRAEVGSNNKKAVWHEFGTSRMPARSFLATSLIDKEREAVAIIGRAVTRGLAGGRP